MTFKSTSPGSVPTSVWRHPVARGGLIGADDRARTGDLDLGKVALYQLSYVRVLLMIADPVSRANRTYEGVASISAVTSSSR